MKPSDILFAILLIPITIAYEIIYQTKKIWTLLKLLKP